jgi:hypothetical protein
MVDPSSRRKIQSVPLKAHPESFQIDASTGRIFVNLPDAHALAVVDGKSGKALASWPMDRSGNFAMALDRDRGRVLVAFRRPPELAGRLKRAATSTTSLSTPGVRESTSVVERALSTCSRQPARLTAIWRASRRPQVRAPRYTCRSRTVYCSPSAPGWAGQRRSGCSSRRLEDRLSGRCTCVQGADVCEIRHGCSS